MRLSKQILAENSDYTNHVYDVIVVGGGIGGLSAGIYLQRYLLSTLIIDKGRARSFWMQEVHNYIGLPPDTSGRKLLQQGKQHYHSLNGDWLNGYVEEVVDEGDTFAVRVKIGRKNSVYKTFRAKYLIAASGIIDHLPPLANMQNVYDYAGYSMHVCLICDGYEMTDKRVGVFVNNESNLGVVYSLGWFTPYITVFTHGLFEISDAARQKLQEHGYQLVETPVERILGEHHQMSGVELQDGSTVELDAGLVAMGSRYHSTYLDGLNLETKGGNLVTDSTLRTSHPRIFAIGDLKVGMNQVAIASADGAIAATQIWREIRNAIGPKRWVENIPQAAKTLSLSA